MFCTEATLKNIKIQIIFNLLLTNKKFTVQYVQVDKTFEQNDGKIE